MILRFGAPDHLGGDVGVAHWLDRCWDENPPEYERFTVNGTIRSRYSSLHYRGGTMAVLYSNSIAAKLPMQSANSIRCLLWETAL